MNNPLIRHIQSADPAALADGERMYIYAGRDEAAVGGKNFVLNDWHIYSSSDLAHWTDHGVGLSVSDFDWASWGAWAGHVTKKGGKYYWYVPMSSPLGGAGFDIGVAIADSPVGPFVAQATPVLTDNMTVASAGNGQPAFKDIDPAVFVDDDGQAYLYWGNIDFHVARLKDNMVELDGAVQYPPLVGFTEAPSMNKINGTYFLTYASGWPEEIAYATSSNPMGPWTFRGRLNPVTGSGTNHQSLVEFRGQWYFIYHNAGLFEGGEFRRSVAMERVHFKDDGLFQQIVQTTAGVEQLDPGPFALQQEYVLRNVHSGLALELEQDSTSPGVNLRQGTPNDSPTQRFNLVAVGAAVYQIRSATSGLCVGIENDSTNASANALQVACDGSSTVNWRAAQSATGDWIFVNFKSNRVLEIANASTSVGANVVQYHYLDGAHQHWKVAPAN
jgi:hypothetical protein